MIKGKNFVFTGLQPWDISIGSNAKDIALEISKQNKVLYINTPLDKKTYQSKENTPEITRRKNVIKKKLPILRQINLNLWVLDFPFTIWPINFLPDGMLFDLANKYNSIRMYSFAKKILKKLHFDNYILFIDNDIYRSFYANEILSPVFSIYYRRDNLVSSYWQKHAPRLEPILSKKCNIVVVNSIQLSESILPYNPKCYDIGQGLDLSKYDYRTKYPKPKDMLNISQPTIGYVGWITSRRLDADLIFEVAKKCRQMSFILVGGEDKYFKNHKLHTLSNVYFLGEKKQEEIPAYVAHFDICMNPQQINQITIGNYPRKIDEYLALGKPVIATKTKAMAMFDKYVWNCTSVDEYIHAIHEALQTNSQELIQKRINFAHTHTWTNSVNQLYSHINI
ncbi:glycosyltransferase [Parabacteroides bouchesdurhonensis]|uniref:glycosyltransferase n=1 Tax=Parabacteroides bouchesdurhonensis TaxID=1936995 RepID=UPI000E486E50|nr:glycosyltransferase [Parabacteroides bouchesdurhonensis]RHJ90403.1 glycosyltransferase [Bacteroides sp. AM07-16]